MAEQNINVAQQDTLESVNSKIDTLDTVADNIYSKVDTEVAAIKTKTDLIGATGDTGGSSTAGSIMAKLNALFSSSGGSSNIGATGDTGGSTTAGTVMGKLNKLISDLTTHMGRWTNTRAGYIDTIKTNTDRLTSARATIIDNIGATGNTGGTTSAGTVMAKLNALIGNTATNNTENKTGVLSQKLTYLINRVSSVVQPSNTTLKQLSSGGTLTVAASIIDNSTATVKVNTATSSWTGYGYIQAPGIYRVSCTFSCTITSEKTGRNNSATLEIQYISCNTGTTTTKTVSLMSSSTNVSSTTKTIDLPLGIGDMIRCRITCKNNPNTDPCNLENGDGFTLTWTDISVRGTKTEITTNVVR